MNLLSLLLLSTGIFTRSCTDQKIRPIRDCSVFLPFDFPAQNGSRESDLASKFAKSTTRIYDSWIMSGLFGRLDGRSMRIIVTLMLLVAALVTLLHWHQDSQGQRCEICFARHLPGIHVPFAAWHA